MVANKNRATEKSQLAAFRKAARELGADESAERFDAALKTIAKHKPRTTPDKIKPTANK
jgi:hypothetical protein